VKEKYLKIRFAVGIKTGQVVLVVHVSSKIRDGERRENGAKENGGKTMLVREIEQG